MKAMCQLVQEIIIKDINQVNIATRIKQNHNKYSLFANLFYFKWVYLSVKDHYL